MVSTSLIWQRRLYLSNFECLLYEASWRLVFCARPNFVYIWHICRFPFGTQTFPLLLLWKMPRYKYTIYWRGSTLTYGHHAENPFQCFIASTETKQTAATQIERCTYFEMWDWEYFIFEIWEKKGSNYFWDLRFWYLLRCEIEHLFLDLRKGNFYLWG